MFLTLPLALIFCDSTTVKEPTSTLAASAVIVFFRETLHAALLHLSQMQLVIMLARDQLLEGRNTGREATTSWGLGRAA